MTHGNYFEEDIDGMDLDEDFPPLPNIEVGTELSTESEGERGQTLVEGAPSGSEWCCLRVTPPDPKDDDLCAGLLDWLQSSFVAKYVMTSELAKKTKKLHYHLAILANCDTEQVRKYFKRMFPECNSGHLYDLAAARDEDYAIAYALKDYKKDSPTLWQTGFTLKQIDTYKRISYKKFSKEEFMVALKEIDKRFLAQSDRSRQTWGRAHEGYIMEIDALKCVTYNQNSNWNWVLAKAETMMKRRFGEPYMRWIVREKLTHYYPYYL